MYERQAARPQCLLAAELQVSEAEETSDVGPDCRGIRRDPQFPPDGVVVPKSLQSYLAIM